VFATVVVFLTTSHIYAKKVDLLIYALDHPDDEPVMADPTFICTQSKAYLVCASRELLKLLIRREVDTGGEFPLPADGDKVRKGASQIGGCGGAGGGASRSRPAQRKILGIGC